MSEITISIPTWVITFVLILALAHVLLDVVNAIVKWRLDRYLKKMEERR